MMSHLCALTLSASIACAPMLLADNAFAVFADFDASRQTSFPVAPEFMGTRELEGELSYSDSQVDQSPARVYARSENNVRFVDGFRMRAEFEYQSGLLVSGDALYQTASTVLSDLARATDGVVPLVILVNEDLEDDHWGQMLQTFFEMGNHVLLIPHDTVWARDYGPTILTDRQRSVVVDSEYAELERSRDDQVPTFLAQFSRAQTRHTTLRLPGGNLLSNGRGLCITTTRVQDENEGMTQAEIAGSIMDSYGAELVAILEPLCGEDTGHVDMFATFTSEHTVVVGKYDPVTDPENAAILDRNAEKLGSLRIGPRRMRVVRIPMPSRHNGTWPTFTNVVYANGRLLVPIYDSTTPQEKHHVNELYAALLPGWEVHFISVDDLICNGGALHCVVSNLGTLSLAQPNVIVATRTTVQKRSRRLVRW